MDDYNWLMVMVIFLNPRVLDLRLFDAKGKRFDAGILPNGFLQDGDESPGIPILKNHLKQIQAYVNFRVVAVRADRVVAVRADKTTILLLVWLHNFMGSYSSS